MTRENEDQKDYENLKEESASDQADRLRARLMDSQGDIDPHGKKKVYSEDGEPGPDSEVSYYARERRTRPSTLQDFDYGLDEKRKES